MSTIDMSSVALDPAVPVDAAVSVRSVSGPD